MNNNRNSLPRSGDPDFDALTILQSGGPNYRALRNFYLPSSPPGKELGSNEIPHADVARAVYGATNEEFAAAVEHDMEMLSHDRPHIFGVKSRFRSVGAQIPSSQSRLISEAEFSELYTAAEFAAEFKLWLDTTVTLNWRLMGVEDEAEKYFLAFTKCLREWMPRGVPHAWIYSHECSPDLGLHTHMALYVRPSDRRGFREWAMGWPGRQFGERIPRSMRVRVHRNEQSWLHWVTFSYLMKGYDPFAVVRSGRNTSDRKSIYLGDLIAAPFRDPGPVKLRNRVGSSASLKATARANGVPNGKEHLKRTSDVVIDPITGGVLGKLSLRDHQYPSFRSSYEDGHRDVRILYSAEFLDWYDRPNVYAASARFPQPPLAPADDEEEDIEALCDRVRTLTFGFPVPRS